MYNIRNEYHSYELGHLIPIDYLQISITIKIDLRRKNKYIACQNLVFIYYTWKNIKKSYKNNK